MNAALLSLMLCSALDFGGIDATPDFHGLDTTPDFRGLDVPAIVPARTPTARAERKPTIPVRIAIRRIPVSTAERRPPVPPIVVSEVAPAIPAAPAQVYDLPMAPAYTTPVPYYAPAYTTPVQSYSGACAGGSCSGGTPRLGLFGWGR